MLQMVLMIIFEQSLRWRLTRRYISTSESCQMRRVDVITYVIGAAILFFCATNVYRSTNQPRSSTLTDLQENHCGSYSWFSFCSFDSNLSRWDNLVLRVWPPYPTQNLTQNASLGQLQTPHVENYSTLSLTAHDVIHHDVSTRAVIHPLPLWQRVLRAKSAYKLKSRNRHRLNLRGSSRSPEVTYYFLTELLQVRIYEDDKAKWTLKELKQWMHYIFLAGVQHIYLCDHFLYEHEKLDVPLKKYIDAGLVTYLPRGSVRDAMTAQTQCYQVCASFICVNDNNCSKHYLIIWYCLAFSI